MDKNNNCLIIGTISSLETLQNICNDKSLAKGADILEIRVDEFMNRSLLKKYMQKLHPKWQFLITIRTDKEGGHWQINDENRYTIFQEFFDDADYFDIELESNLLQQKNRQDFPNNIKIITSYHNYKTSLSDDEINKKINKGLHWQADIIKLALQTNSQNEVEKLQQILQVNTAPLCLIAMGEIGQSSRYKFAKLGSKLTYGYLDKCVAPGQLSCQKLAKLIN